MRTIELMAPGVFKLRKYHGDGRRHVSIAGEKVIQGTMSRQYEIFSGREANASTIVVCSYQTWNERHGPKGFRKWLKKQHPTRLFTKKELNELDVQLDPQWPGNLSRCFDIAALDEAHELKSLRAKASYAVSWLDADFHIMVTATPIPNGVYDFQGYMSFIENRQSNEWWDAGELRQYGLTDQLNPFDDIDDNHPAARLRLTSTAANDYIFNSNIQVAVQGRRLAAIWKVVLIRRTNSSRIPFGNGPSIGESLPRVKSVLLNCTLSLPEYQIYKSQQDKLTNVLIDKASDDKATDNNKPRWNLNTHRTLTMLCTALQLPDIDHLFKLKANNTKKILIEPEYFMDWVKHPPPPIHASVPPLPKDISRKDPAPILFHLLY